MSVAAARRRLPMLLTLVAAILAAGSITVYSLALRDTAYASGWLLLGVCLFLAGYNLRKKLTYPNLGRAASWFRLHLYVGLFSVVAFGLHTGLRFPTGRLELLLAATFVLVAGSGFLGLLLIRILPARLTDRGEEVLYERIPMLRLSVGEEARHLIIRCVENDDSTTLASLYRRSLAQYFHGPRHFWHHLAQSSRPRVRLQQELRSVESYLSDEERTAATKLAELIDAKDDLDYHHAVQSVLKHWLFVHIPLSYAMLVLVAIHVVLVHAFRAGVP